MPTLREVGEFEAIRRVLAARPAAAGVVVGGGDDAAVLRLDPARELVVTTDAFVEDRHWRAGLIEPETIGARLAAANLSDLAAMAARPRWALVSAGLRPDHDLDALLALDAGLARALAAHGAATVGGNFAAVEGAEWLSLTLLGDCAAGRAWTRAGARAGDLIAVTGSPGRAAAGLSLLQRHGVPAGETWWSALAAAWLAPPARIEFARNAAETEAVAAAIDISDGFAADLARLCEASRVGAEIAAAEWPQDPLLDRAAAEIGAEPRALRFAASDDYELVLAVRSGLRGALEAAARALGVPLAFVGRFVAAEGVFEVGADGARRPLPREGWDHFARSSRKTAVPPSR